MISTTYSAKMSWRHCRIFISLHVLVAQVLLEFFDVMKPFEKAVPVHIKNDWLGHFCMNNAVTLS